ncbi:MAG TPA: YIP1 family protein [Myxococcaceae bacterium]|nr:YIP1 family protein [Myxococcaceae bacterium]
MEARCPRCSTVFTTDRSGIQFCPNCGQQVDVPEPPRAASPGWGPGPSGPGAAGGGPGGGRFTGEPPPGGGHAPGHRDLTPWERRKEIGFLKGFFETWKQSLFTPQLFFPTVRPDVPWTEALYYAWIIHAVTIVFAAPFVGLGILSSTLPHNLGDAGQMENAMRAFSGVAGMGWLVLSLLIYPLVVLAVSAIVHLVAMLFGAAQNGYGATVRALCYSAGPNLLSIVPCFGCLTFIYSLVLAIFGVASLQQTSMGKAAGIVLVPFVVVLCCCGLFYGLALASIMSIVNSTASGTRTL